MKFFRSQFNLLVFARCRIHSVTTYPKQRMISVKFHDGSNGLYPYVWLRDCSTDPATYTINDSIKARIPFMRDFDVNVEPEMIELDSSTNELVVQWPGAIISRYSQLWLKQRNLANPEVKRHRRKFHLNDTKAWNKNEIEKRLQKFRYNDFLNNDKVLHDFLCGVCVDGISILTDGPSEEQGETIVNAIGDRIGLIHPTHFGKTFEVTTKQNASNMAYASGGELPYHTDFPSLVNQPELQLLHMMQSADTGGLSMFVDGFKVAEVLKEEAPELYGLLSETYIEYIEEGYDTHLRDKKLHKFEFDMVAKHKVINYQNGNVTSIRFGNAMRSWFIDCDVCQVQQVYNALKKFTEICYRPENQLIFPLKNGETVLWANTRLLHARSAYETKASRERLIAGCYFGWDIVKSKIRLSRDKLSLPENQQSL